MAYGDCNRWYWNIWDALMDDRFNVHFQFEMNHTNNAIVGRSIIVIGTLDSDFDPYISFG